jgi:malate dehydrogenase (quinone)
MLEVMRQMFPDIMNDDKYLDKLKKMIPTFGQSLTNDSKLVKKTRDWTSNVLKLDD